MFPDHSQDIISRKEYILNTTSPHGLDVAFRAVILTTSKRDVFLLKPANSVLPRLILPFDESIPEGVKTEKYKIYLGFKRMECFPYPIPNSCCYYKQMWIYNIRTGARFILGTIEPDNFTGFWLDGKAKIDASPKHKVSMDFIDSVLCERYVQTESANWKSERHHSDQDHSVTIGNLTDSVGHLSVSGSQKDCFAFVLTIVLLIVLLVAVLLHKVVLE